MALRIPFPRSIRTRLTVLVLAVALPLVTLIAFDYSAQLSGSIKLAENTARGRASGIAASLTQLLESERTMLAALAVRPTQRIERPAVCDPLLAEILALNSYRANVVMGTLSGDVLCSAVPQAAGVSVSVLDQAHIQRVIKTGEFSIGEPFIGPITGHWIVPVAFPRRSVDERLIGWLGVPLGVERIGELLARSVIDPDDPITVVSPQGKVIARSGDSAKWIGTDVSKRQFAPAVLAGTLLAWRGPGLDGVARISGAAAVPVAGWKVIAGFDEARVLAPAKAALLRNILVIAMTLLLVAGLALAISRGIAIPILSLATTTRGIASGARHLRAPVTGPTEIAGIASELNRMLDALERSDTERERLRQAIEQTNDMVAISTHDGSLLYANRAGRALLGLGPEDSLAGVNTRQVHTPERWKLIQEVARPRAVEGEVWAEETSLVAHDGRSIPVSQVVVAIRNVRGEVDSFAGISRDISEIRAAHEREVALNRRVAGILESMSDGFVAFDREWRYSYVNLQAAELFGRSAESLVGRKYHDEYPEAIGTPFEEAYRRAMTERVEVQVEAHYAPWDRWFENRIYPTEEGISIFFHEITARKRAEIALAASEQRFRLAASNGQVWDWNFQTNTTSVSTEFWNKLGYDEQVVQESTAMFEKVLHPEDLPRWQQAIAEHKERRIPYRLDFRARAESGEYRWFSTMGQSLWDASGRATYMAGTTFDITERKQAEEELAASERQFRVLAAASPVGIYRTDANGDVTYVNARWSEIAGITPGEALGQGWSKTVRTDRERVYAELFEGVQQHLPLRSEFRFERPDGSVAWVIANAVPEVGELGELIGYLGTVTDITSRRRAEDELQSANQQLRALSSRLLEVQEQERRSIARELHDEVGGVLTAVKLNLQALRRIRQDALSERALTDGLELVDGTIQAVRSLSLDLRPAVLDDLGLIPALKWYCERQSRRAGIPVELALDAIDLKAAPLLESACFRIVQEAVTNALRHASARRVRVTLRRADDNFMLEIADDGRGFDLTEARRQGLAGERGGVLGMEERAKLLGGRLTIESTPAMGTSVRVEFAVPEGGFG